MSDLKSRFNDLCEFYKIEESWISQAYSEIDGYYSEDYRAYHNLTHLDELFRHFDQFEDNLTYKAEVSFAIFYHDLIYKIGSSTNETDSAQFCESALSKTKFDQESLGRISQLIVCTQHHTARTEDEGWMIDFDLSILGQEEKIYKSYARKIREEYKMVSKQMYNKGRIKVLEHFLAKTTIFQTNEFKSLYENQARHNLKNELETLRHGTK